ncbi:hypothetical protein K438DRAFT_1577352 [Mycena galopus ATCC 62051]|nr:hypothetical protein K438DRAFT_1577352 [Mycena galopus ATCC 62051]
MPAVTSGKVLVSGANGFVAAWVVRTLLEEGFSVRGAVRSEQKGSHLKKIFSSNGDKFELAIVPDIAQEGAFNEAVDGVDAIFHTASPFHFNAKDAAEIIRPAVDGTIAILRSAQKHGKSVKRVVVTGSVVSVMQIEPKPRVFTEADWNAQAIKAAEQGRAGALEVRLSYAVSKTLAERAAWDFVEKHKSELGWDLVVLNPPFVFGPTIHDVPTPSTLNTSARQFYNILNKESAPEMLRKANSWIDVRDLGRAHVLSLLKEAAGGERIIVTAGKFVWQEWRAYDITPFDPAHNGRYQKGIPGCAKDTVYHVTYDTSKSVRVLGLTYRSKEETLRDTVADWEERGW